MKNNKLMLLVELIILIMVAMLMIYKHMNDLLMITIGIVAIIGAAYSILIMVTPEEDLAEDNDN